LSRRTTVIQDLLVRHQFSLVLDNRTNVNVEACLPFLFNSKVVIIYVNICVIIMYLSNLFLKKIKLK
jgi:hypothetical protein